MGTLCPTHMICFKHTLVFIGNFTPHINKFVEHLMLYTLYGFVYGWGFYRPFTKPKYIVFGSVISAILRALVAERDLIWCRRRCVCVFARVFGSPFVQNPKWCCKHFGCANEVRLDACVCCVVDVNRNSKFTSATE